MNKLFVYGIFLGKGMREAYGMTNPQYATVKDYITQGGQIVWAVPVDPEFGTALTGLLVDADPNQWERLDAMEGAYDRVQVITTNGDEAYMYVARKSRYERK